jgi:hypothetical protein
MANKKAYIFTLRNVIRDLHGCGSTHVTTVPVHEVFRGETVWQGDVEVLDLIGHPKAKRCYVWSHWEGDKDGRTRFVAVLGIPPVVSPETAVRTSMVADARPELKKQTNNAEAEIAKRNRWN